MKDYTKILTWGISFVIVFTTYLSVAQGWGIKPMTNETVVKKYKGNSNQYYGQENKVLRDSVLAVRKRVKDSLRKRRKDSLKKVEKRFNLTRDSLLSHGYNTTSLATYAGGKYLYAYGKRPSDRSSSSSSSGYSSSSSRYSSSSSSRSVGSFRGGSSRSFRGGSRRGGK